MQRHCFKSYRKKLVNFGSFCNFNTLLICSNNSENEKNSITVCKQAKKKDGLGKFVMKLLNK